MHKISNESYEDYKDIIFFEHHVSKKHKSMDGQMRAAQFAPFSALTGLEDAVNKAAYTYEVEFLNETRKLP